MLPTDRAALLQALARGEVFRYRYFWGHRPSPDGRLSNSCFSQWWACDFEIDGVTYQSAEQFMMARKALLFGDLAIHRKILQTSDPGKAKALGRRVSGFDEAAWNAVRFDLVTSGNVAKFTQNPRLRNHLDKTEYDVLVEASPMDVIWGIGLTQSSPGAGDPAAWPGLNLLGFALVRARSVIRGETTAPHT